MTFEFATAGRIVFGAGAISQLPQIAAGFGDNAFLVTGRRADPGTAIASALRDAGISVTAFATSGEPSLATLADAVAAARAAQVKLVIAVGGGSTIDTGKAVAALLANEGDIMDYLEVVGAGRPLAAPSVPFIAVPTTAGTGSEVTRNAVIGVPDKQVKVSMRSPHMLPRVALVDPDLTHSMPPEVTASTGLDALTQLLEAFVSKRANPLADGICREGLVRTARSLRRAYCEPTNGAAREDMSLAGLFGGLALANAGLGAVHGFAGPIGGMFNAPHGMVCAALLPHAFRVNVSAAQERAPGSPMLGRYCEVARILTGRPDAPPGDAIDWLAGICADLRVASLKEFGVRREHLPEIAAKAREASSMKGNPIKLTDDELLGILEAAM